MVPLPHDHSRVIPLDHDRVARLPRTTKKSPDRLHSPLDSSPLKSALVFQARGGGEGARNCTDGASSGLAFRCPLTTSRPCCFWMYFERRGSLLHSPSPSSPSASQRMLTIVGSTLLPVRHSQPYHL